MKKKTFLILLVSSLFLQSSFCQKKLEYGINAGINYTNLRGNTSLENLNSDFGYLIGITVEYNFNKATSLKTGINYERKNSSTGNVDIADQFGNITGTTKGKIVFDYLTIPVLLKYKFYDSYFLNGGPFLSYLLKNEDEIVGFNSIDNTDSMKEFDFGLSFGVGKRIKLSEKNILEIEVRNNLGLSNISDVTVINNGSIKTNSLNLILGLTF